MCGIAGIVNFDRAPVSPVKLRNMTDVIAHRGPDGEGHWMEDGVGLGHRRLAILDLSPAGHQPMISADHRFVLTYNGEVYNYQELRLELESIGYWFRSKTDSEVVLYALAEWGTDALQRFNGMFAFGFWDRKEKSLLLGRDRYGIKPLYYTCQGTTIAFGSEQKAILSLTDITTDINKRALVEYFTFQNLFTDQTLTEGIYILPAGHYAKVDAFNCNPQKTKVCYWDFHFQGSRELKSKQEYIEELDRLLNQAVSRQLVSDVEIGAYLSGGMDSGSLTAIATETFPYLKTFTCGFDLSSASGMELAYDERVKAEAMSARFKSEHYEMVLKAGDMERCLSKFSWHMEEPRVGQSYPNYYVAGLASKFVKVVLSGTGGDELFAGYPWRYYKIIDNVGFEDYIDKYYKYWQRLIPNSDLREVFEPIWDDVKDVWTRDIFRDVFISHKNSLCEPEDYINHSLYFESKTFLHGLLVVEDKLSMAHSLETRVPFLDNDLVDFAMICPVGLKLNSMKNFSGMNENTEMKYKKYFQKTNDGKKILRDVMASYIPSEIAKGVKQGFSSPDASWFKGESIDFVKKRLFKGNAMIYDYLNREKVKSLVMEHLEGDVNRRLLIWGLLNVESWLENYA